MKTFLVPLAVAFVLWFLTGFFNPIGVLPPVSKLPTHEKIAALTFDDGPSPSTPAILDALQKMHVKATFFVLGSEAERFPEMVKQMSALGHEVENHSWSHPHLPFHGPTFVRRELLTTNEEISRLSGTEPHFFRPPYGQTHLGILKISQDLGLKTVFWSITSRDWLSPGTDRISAIVESRLSPGAIILFHDGGGNRQQTAAALFTIIPFAKAQGYRFATLREIL